MNNELDNGDSLIEVTEDLEESKDHCNLDYPVGAYLINFENMQIKYVRWHWHDEMEIFLVTSGRAEFLINDESFVLSEGQAIFINRNILHAARPVKGETCAYISIVFHPLFLFGHNQTQLAATYLIPISSNSDLRYVLFNGTESFHKDVIVLLQDAFSFNLHKPFGYELLTRNALSSFWLLLLEHLGTDRISPSLRKSNQHTLDQSRTQEAILFIQKHYNDVITLEDIADSIHVSKGECCRCFKRSTNLTPFEYLMRYRIFIAAGMIMENRHVSIADLASCVGFNSSSYFNKLFKKYLNCTPTEYKSRCIKRD